jgi:hypothetical protein
LAYNNLNKKFMELKNYHLKISRILRLLELLESKLNNAIFKNLRPTEIGKIEERLGRISSELVRLDSIIEIMTASINERVIDQQKDEAIRLDIVNGLSRAEIVSKHKIGHSHLKYKTEISGHIALTDKQLQDFKNK